MNDFIHNGQGSGTVADRLIANNFNVGALRPYLGKDGRSYITMVDNMGNAKAVPITNAPASLRKDDWKILDEAVVRVAKERLRAVADIRSAGLTFNLPNGMGKTVLETETQGDISEATISMDGLRMGQADRPHFELTNLPLPIIHKDFNFTARQLATSRSGGSPLDTTSAELAGRRVAEEAEKLLIGTSSSFAYGGGTVYGYTNFPSRITATITAPTASGWTGATLLAEVLAMKTQSQDAKHFGPWVLYTGTAWDQYLDNDYVVAAPQNTLRDRLRKIESITDVRTLDHLTGFDIVMVQMTSNVVREVIGMDINTVQWESHGGLQLNFKVMAIIVPQLRADFNGNTGIVHGTV